MRGDGGRPRLRTSHTATGPVYDRRHRPRRPRRAGLSVFVGYAEDKEINTPDPAAFPVPWAGVAQHHLPGRDRSRPDRVRHPHGLLRHGRHQAGQPGDSTDHRVQRVGGHALVDTRRQAVQQPLGVLHGRAGPERDPGRESARQQPRLRQLRHQRVSEQHCTPITVAPTVTITVGGVATTLADSTHVLDTGGIDPGTCPPKHNESIQWRAIGAAGVKRRDADPRPGHGHRPGRPAGHRDRDTARRQRGRPAATRWSTSR